MSDLLELAARCEASEGRDRELDADIARGLGYTTTVEQWQGQIRRFYGNGALGVIARLAKKTLPRFSASLDAAMQLIDDDTFFHISRFGPDEAPKRGEAHVFPNRFVGDDYRGDAANPALALCAAALRARGSAQS